MSIVIPGPIKKYPQPVNVFASKHFNLPSEGKQYIPLEFDWALSPVQEVDLSGNSQQPFTQLVMLDVDNTSCGSDVTFFFLDTGDTLVVPAYNSGLFPVFTNRCSFVAATVNPLSTDITRVRALNYAQEPVDNPKLIFNTPVAVSIATLASGNTVIIPAGTTGTIGTLQIGVNGVGGAGTGEVQLALDTAIFGAPTSFVSEFTVASGQGFFYQLANLQSFNVRFSNGIGLVLVATGVAIAGTLTLNLTYRTP